MSAAVKVRTGTAGNGQPIYAAPVAYACFITQDVVEIRDTAGQQRTTTGRIAFTFPGPPTLTPQDQIALPNGTTPLIVKVQRDNNVAALQVQPVTAWLS